MDSKIRYELIGLNTGGQSNLVLYDVLCQKQLTAFFRLVVQGYALSAFILNAMIDNGFENSIPKALDVCKRHNPDIYDFFVKYWGRQKAEEYFVIHGFSALVKEKFSDESLVLYQEWDFLLEREKYSLFVENAPFAVLEEMANGRYENRILDALPYSKLFNVILALNKNYYLTNFQSGRLKLLEIEDWKTIFASYWKKGYAAYGFGNEEDFFQYVIDHNGTEQLFDSNLQQGWEYLLEQKITAPFVEHKLWACLVEHGFYNVIDWEDYWLNSSDKKSVLEHAVKAKNWDFLEKHGCRRALFKKFRWCRFLRVVKR